MTRDNHRKPSHCNAVLNGLDATRRILKVVPATKVLMLSVHSDDSYVKSVISSGAMGYLIKQTCAESVCPAIRAVQKGNTFFCVFR